MIATFFDGLDELYNHAKFGGDRTKRAGCRCENMVFCIFFICFLMFFFVMSRSEAGGPGALFVRR